MKTPMAMQYWKDKEGWTGRLVEHPEITAHGRTLQELEENVTYAYQQTTLGAAPAEGTGIPSDTAGRRSRPTGSVPLFPPLRHVHGRMRPRGLLARIRAGIRKLF
jgi:predicted RNase H-like HicB family nuclease